MVKKEIKNNKLTLEEEIKKLKVESRESIHFNLRMIDTSDMPLEAEEFIVKLCKKLD